MSMSFWSGPTLGFWFALLGGFADIFDDHFLDSTFLGDHACNYHWTVCRRTVHIHAVFAADKTRYVSLHIYIYCTLYI